MYKLRKFKNRHQNYRSIALLSIGYKHFKILIYAWGIITSTLIISALACPVVHKQFSLQQNECPVQALYENLWHGKINIETMACHVQYITALTAEKRRHSYIKNAILLHSVLIAK